MAAKGHILIVDDDEDILTAGKLLLRRHHYQVVTCNDPDQVPDIIEKNQFHAVLLDMNFGPGESSGKQGLNWLQKIRIFDPNCVVVMITAHGGMNLAIEAMKLGATDFVTKPWQNEKLVATISTAVELGEARSEAKQLRTTNQILTEVTSKSEQPIILGNSQAMKGVMSLVKRSAPTDANVLILGENGTGKELIARELHYQSMRKSHVFMSVDLGSISETLFESELFGHKKGAFTGANEDRVGRLKAADGGSLFLDEIGNLPLHLQTKLLTVLEQRQVTPLGANKATSFDVRVICATNSSKQNLMDESKFRPDLLFRLNTVEITLPPLRDRPDDIITIAGHYLLHYCKKYNKPANHLSVEAAKTISQYHWPGNIRALRHAIERAVILSESVELTSADFQLTSASNSASTTTNTLSAVVEPADSATSSELNLEKIEKMTIEKALKTHRYNISHTAKALGLTRAALYRRMEKYGL